MRDIYIALNESAIHQRPTPLEKKSNSGFQNMSDNPANLAFRLL